MNCSLPGSSVHGILQARVLEWVATFFSRGSSWSRDQTWVSCIAGRFLTVRATREAHIMSKFQINYTQSLRWNFQFIAVTQSCPTLCDPMNRSTPGLPVHHQIPEFTQTRVESVMPSSHLILCRPLLLPPTIPPSITVFSNESTLCMRWPK